MRELTELESRSAAASVIHAWTAFAPSQHNLRLVRKRLDDKEELTRAMNYRITSLTCTRCGLSLAPL